MAREVRTVRSQMGPFGILPLWVLERVTRAARDGGKDGHAASLAIHVYAVLAAKYANREHRAWPTRELLADTVGASVPRLARALRVLRVAGAIQTSRRHREDGSVSGLDYLLVQVDPSPEGLRHQVTGDPMAADDHQVTGDPMAADDHQVTGDPMAADDHQVTGDLMAANHQVTGDLTIRSLVIPPIKGRTRSIEPDPEEGEGAAAPVPPPPGTPLGTPDDPTKPDPVEALRCAWNELTTAPLAPCQALTPTRRRLIRAGLVAHPLAVWREIFARLNASAFCRGERAGGGGWPMSFDQVLRSPDIAVRLLEGVYDDHLSEHDRADARDYRFRATGSPRSCPHTPVCADDEACLQRIAVRLRAHREAS